MYKADGFDDCVIGVTRIAGQEDRIIYNYDKCIDKLMKDGMEYDDAIDYMEFNVVAAHMGPGTPTFVEPESLKDIEERESIKSREASTKEMSKFRCDACTVADGALPCFLKIPMDGAQVPDVCPYGQSSCPDWKKVESFKNNAWFDGGEE